MRSETSAGECPFCRISRGDLPATKVREEEDLVAFRDLNPQAPTHILIIPRKHVASVDALEEEDAALAGRLLLAAREIAREEGLARDGYRVVLNTGPGGGQTVFHLHAHLLGGRTFSWPPG